MELLDFEELSELDHLAQEYSDFHKEEYGFRPRHTEGWTEGDFRKAIKGIHDSHDRAKKTFAGRESLRENGWWVDETDPVLQQQAIWLAEERDREKKEYYGEDWKDFMAEAPKLRKNWNVQ